LTPLETFETFLSQAKPKIQNNNFIPLLKILEFNISKAQQNQLNFEKGEHQSRSFRLTSFHPFYADQSTIIYTPSLLSFNKNISKHNPK